MKLITFKKKKKKLLHKKMLHKAGVKDAEGRLAATQKPTQILTLQKTHSFPEFHQRFKAFSKHEAPFEHKLQNEESLTQITHHILSRLTAKHSFCCTNYTPTQH